MEIIKLSPMAARKHFLKNKSYVNFELPKYFNFEHVFERIETITNGKNFKEFYKSKMSPKCFENVNYKLFHNKDGSFAWRPLQIIHPLLYLRLVNLMTKESNWGILVERFLYFRKHNLIECTSIPEVARKGRTNKAAQIHKWLNRVEQRSLELALDFDNVFHTDITDCYGAIYTHAIVWALHTKAVGKQDRSDKLLGNNIDEILREMSYGETNGIPQGSDLMDFIAELVLGYVDELITSRIIELKLSESDFKILRYRDDYRVFVNEPSIGQNITRIISEELANLGLHLSGSKTTHSTNVLIDSVKPDKNYRLKHPFNWHTIDHDLNKFTIKQLSVSQRIQTIYLFASKNPNSGSLTVALQGLLKDVENGLDIISPHLKVILSFLVNIALNNPKTYEVVSALISKVLDKVPEDEQEQLLTKIINKLNQVPNTGVLQVWIQRFAMKFMFQINTDELLCQKVTDNSVVIWNSEWLTDQLEEIINETSIIDEKVLEALPKTISSEEVNTFDYQYDS